MTKKKKKKKKRWIHDCMCCGWSGYKSELVFSIEKFCGTCPTCGEDSFAYMRDFSKPKLTHAPQ